MIISDLLNKILNQQTAQEDFLPKITQHVTPEIYRYEDGYFGFTVQLDGIPFESQSETHLEAYFNQLSLLFASMGKVLGNRLGLWTTLQRRHRDFDREYQFNNIFSAEFSQKYITKLQKDPYFSNKFYISVVIKNPDVNDGIKECNDLMMTMLQALQPYTPKVLKAHANESGVIVSEAFTFLSSLINHEHTPIPLSAVHAYKTLGNADLHFGSDITEIRNQRSTKYCSAFDLKDYGVSRVCALVDVLDLPCEFTLTQSFVYLNNSTIQSEVKKQLNNLQSSGDQAVEQQEELLYGMGLLTAGELMFGEYHAALVVYGDTPQEAVANAAKASTRFLNSGGYFFSKAGLSAPATYFGQVPNSKLKPRAYPKTTQNLASSFGMHNYSSGKEFGNPIGDGTAIMPLKTVSNTIYDFNWHYSNLDEDNLGDKIAGHTLILGATGTGKTTLETALLTFTNRFNPSLFVMDLDAGMKIFINAIGGRYFTLSAGMPTGLNPFQLPDSPKNREFLYSLVAVCGQNDRETVSADEERQIKLAVDTLYSLESRYRNFSTLLESIPYSTEDNALRSRLMKWTRSEGGRFAWCLDNEENLFNPDDFTIIGFDLTDILQDKYPPTEPVLMYLFHLRTLMMERVAKNGGILCTVVEEFWWPLRFKATSELMLKILKTDRKL